LSTVYLSAKTQGDENSVIAGVDKKLLTWIGSSDNFSVTAQSQIVSTLTSVQNSLTLLLGGVAGISLIVGGIGIMNIMLVSVTERTREIGIRKAVGASRGAILGQFLIEALVLSGIGGLLGVAAGAAASAILDHSFGYQVSFHSGIAGLAFGFALAVGLIFGLWPANRAAGLRPVDALRTE
jgi:putative ABC transport system permease protein